MASASRMGGQSRYKWEILKESYFNLFTELTKLFNMELTPKQLHMLNELYNSEDESNQRVAAAMFQTIMLQNLKEKL
jgi:hypothetical protein